VLGHEPGEPGGVDEAEGEHVEEMFLVFSAAKNRLSASRGLPFGPSMKQTTTITVARTWSRAAALPGGGLARDSVPCPLCTVWIGAQSPRAPASLARTTASLCRSVTDHGGSPRITSSGLPSRPMTKAHVGKRRDAATGGDAVGGHAAGGDTPGDCCDSCDKPRFHDTSRRQRPNSWPGWGRSFRSSALGCGGDIRLIALHPSPGRSGRS
jgi:hypothetical protein